MSDVFVSYKAEDRRRVKPLVEALEADGFSVWWDEQIGGGAAWRHEIEVELNAAKCAIVVWSKRSVGPEGTFVQDEATRAQERHVYVPVTIDKVHLPLGFGETHALSLTGWHGDRSDPHYRAALAAVKRMAGGGNVSPTDRHSTTFVDRRAVLAGGAVAGVAIIGVGGWVFLRPGPAAASNSIAVLPFANLSGDPRQTYFSDGIAEELRNALARLAGLKVVARISSEAVRNLDAKTAARKLRVANVLTGSVRQSASTIRIGAELIDGRTGLDRWSNDYDRPPGDSIMIQTDIAENVASSLAVALGTVARAAISIGGTSNAAAQRLVIEARAIAREATQAARQHALELVDSAIRLDPNYADAYAQKSLMLGSYANNSAIGAAELASARAEAMHVAQTAIRIAPKLGLGHAAAAQLFQSDLDMARAANEFQRAVQLAPGNADIVGRYVFLLARLGKPAEALKTADNVIALDPLNHFSYENRVSALYDLRRYQEAIDYAEKVRRQSPELFRAQGLYADCLLMLGRLKEASRTYGLLTPDSWQQLNGQALALARAGDRAGAMKMLAKFKQLYGEASSYQYSGIYAQLGDRKRALDSLERALTIRDGGLVSIKIDPQLDPIRGEPRLDAVVKRMNFPT
jgi:TolB-like protein/tetratricopeptide (TPR) repeat protein